MADKILEFRESLIRYAELPARRSDAHFRACFPDVSQSWDQAARVLEANRALFKEVSARVLGIRGDVLIDTPAQDQRSEARH
jgi:hypothetical protein